MKKEMDKLVLWIMIVLLAVIGLYFLFKPAGREIYPSPPFNNVTRAITPSSAFTNTDIDINLIVKVAAGDRVYSIEEVLPSGTTLVNAGDGSNFTSAGIQKIRWIEYNNVTNTVKNYKVKFSSPGTYTFSGTYVFNNESEYSIFGATQIIITSPQCLIDTDCSDDGNVCTTETCSAGICIRSNNTNSCNDNLYCTSGDMCSLGGCHGVSNSTLCPADTNLNGCVSVDETATYAYNWLNNLALITQFQVTSNVDLWKRGITAC